VEVGQNARTALTQAVADELRLDPGSVRLVMGDTARVPFDMGTFGSRTTPTMAPQLRRAAAAARALLIGLAAERLGVPAEELDSEFGVVPIDPDNHLYTVMVDEQTGAAAAERPDVDGPYSNPRIEPFGPPSR
jgi:CO/xanthine dehydrogenase Mo-binding subunit